MSSHSSSLQCNEIGDAGAKAVAEVLRINTTLHTLKYDVASRSHPSSLQLNHIGEAGANAVAEALCTNTTLHMLEYDAAMVSSAISSIQPLRESYWRRGCKGNGGSTANKHRPAQANVSCRGAVECHLTHPVSTPITLAKRVQRQWRKHCAQTPPCTRSSKMRCCRVPSHLSSLYNNDIGEAGAKAVAEALRTNTTLHTLMYDAAVLSSAISPIQPLQQ